MGGVRRGSTFCKVSFFDVYGGAVSQDLNDARSNELALEKH